MTEAHEPNVNAVTQGAALERADQNSGSDNQNVGSPLFESFRSKQQTRVRWFQWPFTLSGWLFLIMAALAVPVWVVALMRAQGRGPTIAVTFSPAMATTVVCALLLVVAVVGFMILMLGRALRAIEQRLERIERLGERR
ncbi:MAG: hypothetical protein RIR10_1355 [Planctomycetota bacterium]